MEVNKLYKNVYTGVIIKCTTASNGGSFGGVVVDSGRSKHSVGFDCSRWVCASFKEYAPTQVLTNGHSYNIPDGCKATIVDGVITIESNVRYYKESCVGCDTYFRVEGNKMVTIEIHNDDDKAVFFADSLLNVECKQECTEEEFMEVYNSIVKI